MSFPLVYLKPDNTFNMADSFDIAASSAAELDTVFNILGIQIPTFTDSYELKEKLKEEGTKGIISCDDMLVACDLILGDKTIFEKHYFLNEDPEDIASTISLIEDIKEKSLQGYRIVQLL